MKMTRQRNKTEEELTSELLTYNKEAAKSEIEFNESYQKLTEEEKLNFSQWLLKQEMESESKEPRVLKRNNRENLLRSIKILKRKTKQLNFLERKLRRHRNSYKSFRVN
jgi:hypothetical protein